MTERLRAVVGLAYPRPEYIDMVHKAGGVSKLTPEEHAKAIKEVKAGEWCDDLPLESRAYLVAKGAVAVVHDEPKLKPKPKPPPEPEEEEELNG